MICVAIIMTVILVALQIPSIAARRAVKKQERQIDIALVLMEIRGLNRLETASMQLTHVGKIEQSYGIIPNAIAGDEITFLAVGDVIAGVDLSKLDATDVRSDGTVATISLPPSEIFFTRIDNSRSRVIDRDTGALRRSDEHLESRARAAAEVAIRNDALKRGVLAIADKNAEARMAEMLKKFGFQEVRFTRPKRFHPNG